jgi:phosphoglycolate phosphatase-like HAD superfamily hydrolase
LEFFPLSIAIEVASSYLARPIMVRLVLFDIDGTLILSGGAGEKAFGRVCETLFGVSNGTAQLKFAGRTDPSIVRDFFKQHGIAPSPENFQHFFDAYVFWLDHLLGQLEGRVLPNVRERVRELNALPEPPLIGLLTGNIRLGAQIKLRHYQLWDPFRTGGFGDDHEDRNQIAAVARDRGSRVLGRALHGEEIVVIGDTPRDIECGQAIGARVLAVATGTYSVEELRHHQPTWTVPTLEAISVREICG